MRKPQKEYKLSSGIIIQQFDDYCGILDVSRDDIIVSEEDMDELITTLKEVNKCLDHSMNGTIT